MIELDIEAKAERARRTFRELAKRVKDKRPIFKKFASYYETDIIPASWESQGRIMQNTQWTPLIWWYAAWKREKFPGKRILELTGWLQVQARRLKKDIKKNSLSLGLSGWEGFYDHQHGKPSEELPARPYFYTKQGDLPNRAWAKLIQLTDDYLTETDK